jgi:mannose-6-phosphate isomerase-like protein (cupin superfamily)
MPESQVSPALSPFVRRLGAELVEEFGIRCERFMPAGDRDTAPFGAMFCVVAPGERVLDRHEDGELLLVVHGRGRAEIGGSACDIAAGDAVYIPHGVAHDIVNVDARADLSWVSVYWDPPADR